VSTAESGQDPQNIYDNTEFFVGYKALRQNDSGLNGAMEIPALRSMLPALSGRSILDLGCGFGDFARYARQAGAASVVAVDVSARMLDEAVGQTDDRAIAYRHSSIEQYLPEAKSFDLVVSSLALHYVPDYEAVVHRVYAALKPGGWFVFSVEHPTCTANSMGWIRNAAGESVGWSLDHYQEEGRRATTWFVDGVIKYHRTIATYVNTLIRAGFRVQMLCEPTPTAEALALRPALLAENRRPPFLLLAAVRP